MSKAGDPRRKKKEGEFDHRHDQDQYKHGQSHVYTSGIDELRTVILESIFFSTQVSPPPPPPPSYSQPAAPPRLQSPQLSVLAPSFCPRGRIRAYITTAFHWLDEVSNVFQRLGKKRTQPESNGRHSNKYEDSPGMRGQWEQILSSFLLISYFLGCFLNFSSSPSFFASSLMIIMTRYRSWSCLVEYGIYIYIYMPFD